MASRCAYSSSNIKTLEESPLYLEQVFEFPWVPGRSRDAKFARVGSLHSAIDEKYPGARILEASTKSLDPLGVALSAFNLRLPEELGGQILESTYQGSKVYRDVGGRLFAQEQLRSLPPERAKAENFQDANLRLSHFELNGLVWAAHHGSLFYDFLFWACLLEKPKVMEQIRRFDFFTDIEFNKTSLGFQPGKSFNSQSKSAAIAKTIDRLCPEQWNVENALEWFFHRSQQYPAPSDSFLF